MCCHSLESISMNYEPNSSSLLVESESPDRGGGVWASDCPMASFFSSLIRPPQSVPQTPTAQPAPHLPSNPSTTAQASYGTTTNPIPDLRTEDPMILWQSLYQDGYCILPGAVEKREVDAALRAINRSMGKHVPNRQDMCPDCPNTPAITDLFNKSSLKGVVNTLLGDYGAVGGGQIALRFPGDNAGENFEIPPNWQYHWHIDGLGDFKDKQKSALFGDVNNFSALVGVVLQDAEEEFMGNLTVYPGSHFQLQNYFRIYGFDDLYTKGVQGLPQLDFNCTRPVQIRARAGDAIILNYSTAHNIAPNISPFIRYTVYFRVTTVNGIQQRRTAFASPMSAMSSMANSSPTRHRPEAMLSVWSDWRGLQRMPFHSSCENGGGVVAIPRNEIQSPGQRKLSASAPQKSGTTEEEEDRELALAIERSKYET